MVRRLTVLCLASAVLCAIPLLPSGSAAAQSTKPAENVEIDGTPQLKWQPANVTVAPGGTVTFKIVGATPHPVGSGSAPPKDDGKFDTSGCNADKLSGDGASCTVRFEKVGTYPFFCTLHYAAGMVGTITITVGGDGAATPSPATATTSAGAAPLVTTPGRSRPPPRAGRPSTGWATACSRSAP